MKENMEPIHWEIGDPLSLEEHELADLLHDEAYARLKIVGALVWRDDFAWTVVPFDSLKAEFPHWDDAYFKAKLEVSASGWSFCIDFDAEVVFCKVLPICLDCSDLPRSCRN